MKVPGTGAMTRRTMVSALTVGPWLAPARGAVPAVPEGPVPGFEQATWPIEPNAIDAVVLAALERHGLQPAFPTADEIFCRRIFLDLLGTLPTPAEVLAFVNDRRPDKRARLIDSLFEREEFLDYATLKWCDLLRVKAEFPINLWPNAVQAYHRWVRDALRENRPYDQFARELLTSSGSNFRVPPVNFYRGLQIRDPAGLAEAVALTFMGARLDSWPEEKQKDLAAFFSRVAYKKTAEWKEEIVYNDPAATQPLAARLPDGTAVTIPAGDDPRRIFTDWLLAPSNPWFAKAVVNRLWAWLVGRGIVHEPDDIRPDNPPSNPELLALLERELVAANYDLRHVYRLILNSRTYQQSAIPRGADPRTEALFGHYVVRRLDAEVLADAFYYLTGSWDTYSSPIPEPFTFIPENQRTIALADGSISSSFLELFGRPPRDTGLESERNLAASDAQRLYLLNSSDIQRGLERSPKLRELTTWAKGNRTDLIRGTYLLIVSRYPTAAEQAAAEKYFATPGLRADQALVDIAWALINGKEFLYRH